MINEYIELVAFFCRLELRNCSSTQNCCICQSNAVIPDTYDNVRYSCYNCNTEIIKRAILLYDKQKSLIDNVKNGFWCFRWFVGKQTKL